MIKPTKVTPLNTTKYLYYKCYNCNKEGEIFLDNSIMNVNDQGQLIEDLDYECPKCGKKLSIN